MLGYRNYIWRGLSVEAEVCPAYKVPAGLEAKEVGAWDRRFREAGVLEEL